METDGESWCGVLIIGIMCMMSKVLRRLIVIDLSGSKDHKSRALHFTYVLYI